MMFRINSTLSGSVAKGSGLQTLNPTPIPKP